MLALSNRLSPLDVTHTMLVGGETRTLPLQLSARLKAKPIPRPFDATLDTGSTPHCPASGPEGGILPMGGTNPFRTQSWWLISVIVSIHRALYWCEADFVHPQLLFV